MEDRGLPNMQEARRLIMLRRSARRLLVEALCAARGEEGVGVWGIWFVTYGTYADIERDGDIAPRLVAGPLTFAAAARMVEERGFGYCVKPWAPRDA